MKEQSRTCRWCRTRPGRRYGGTLCDECSDEAHLAEDNLGMHVLVRLGTWEDNINDVDELKRAWDETETTCKECSERTNIKCDICGDHRCRSHSGAFGFYDEEGGIDDGPAPWGGWVLIGCPGCLQQIHDTFRDRPESRNALARFLRRLVKGEVDLGGLTALE